MQAPKFVEAGLSSPHAGAEPYTMEKRRNVRVSLSQEVECTSAAGIFRGQVADISVSGLFVEMARPPVTPGSVITVKFPLPDCEKPVAAWAKVNYVQEGIGLGIVFVGLGPEERASIARYVEAAAFDKLLRSEPRLRRSSRISVKVPVTLRGTGRDGQPFEEQTNIVSVSKDGASLATDASLEVGMKVFLSTQTGQEFKCCVAWVGDASNPRGRGRSGIQCRGLAHALGFRFP